MTVPNLVRSELFVVSFKLKHVDLGDRLVPNLGTESSSFVSNGKIFKDTVKTYSLFQKVITKIFKSGNVYKI